MNYSTSEQTILLDSFNGSLLEHVSDYSSYYITVNTNGMTTIE